MNVKVDRINSELQRQISIIISEDIKDPRIGTTIITVTKVKTTPDLKFAKVYVSVYTKDNNKEQQKESYDTVVRSALFIRNELKGRVKMRNIPELHFVLDTVEEEGSKIDEILKTLVIPPAPQEDEDK